MTESEIQFFVAEGFVRIAAAFARETADAGRAILWADTGCDSNDPATWKKAVVRLGDHGQQPLLALPVRAIGRQTTPYSDSVFPRIRT
jgi:hypothetical protein